MVDVERIQSSSFVEPPEPYAHGVRAGRLVFISGQPAFDNHNDIVGRGDPGRQAYQAWKNVQTVVESAGGSLSDIVKITVFVSDIRYATDEIRVRAALFQGHQLPACTLIQAANLGLPEILLEIEAIAILADRDTND